MRSTSAVRHRGSEGRHGGRRREAATGFQEPANRL